MRLELDKSLRKTEAWFNGSTAILDEFNLERTPHYSSFCRWEQKFRIRELRRLLRAAAEQAGWSGEAAIDASHRSRIINSADFARYVILSMVGPGRDVYRYSDRGLEDLEVIHCIEQILNRLIESYLNPFLCVLLDRSEVGLTMGSASRKQSAL